MQLSQRYERFIYKCFNYEYFDRYRFNYGDGNFCQHKIINTPLPAYIQTKFALRAHDWMGYVKMLIDTHGHEGWFTVCQTLYGTFHDTYVVTEYNGWYDVYNKKKAKRVYNSGPNDTPIDVFWLLVINLAYADDTSVEDVARMFLNTIWFYLCEKQDEAITDLKCIHNNYVCKFYLKN